LSQGTENEHVNVARLQAFLEGELPRREHAGVEEHLVGCARCSAELDAWKVLFSDLDGLSSLRPHEGFADHVMAGVRIPEPVPLAARIRKRLGSFVPARSGGHVGADRLQDFLEGLLPGRRMAQVELHLQACSDCSAEAENWRGVMRRLDVIERLAPRAGFDERVMAGVGIPALAHAPASVPTWHHALAWGRRLVPRTRRAWAALSGVAVTPAVTVGLVFYVVFSHPTLTPSALVSFAWWQVTDLAALGWNALAAVALESAQLFGIYSLVETLASAPFAVAGGLLVYSVGCAFALRVLYRNLISTRAVEGRYAHLTVS